MAQECHKCGREEMEKADEKFYRCNYCGFQPHIQSVEKDHTIEYDN